MCTWFHPINTLPKTRVESYHSIVAKEFSHNLDPVPLMTVVKDATESVAKLSGKKKKTRLKVRDHGQEKAKCLTNVQYNS